YVWEVYVPAKARKHGYYVLPLLWGDRLVGRIEPRIDRKASVLRVPAPRLEHRMRRTERLELEEALGRALEALRRFSGAGRIERA
ncbi:MAG: DNA glycosylase AlkZ-like family protein, partial [Myxococcaceae bacterium]